MEKKVIIFDLDETLRKLEFDRSYEKVLKVSLRPNINALLKKIKEVKEEGIDIMIYTTASSESAQKYFIDCLPKKYRDIFCRVISSDNKLKLEEKSKEREVYGNNTSNKPVTAIEGYNQILFFDDNSTELEYLKEMYKQESDSPNKQVIFASYSYAPIKPYNLYAFKRMSEENNEIAEKVNMLFTKLLEEPGCALMIEKIDEFQQTKFVKGLSLDTDNMKLKYHQEVISDIEEEIEDLIYEDTELEKRYDEFYKEYYLLNNSRKDMHNDDSLDIEPC